MEMKFGLQLGLGSGHIVLDGDPAPLPKWHSPQFSAPVWCHKTAGWIKIKLPLPQGNTAPRFSADVYCGQMAGWMKMPLGTEADLGPGHIVLDGTQLHLPRKRGTAAPIFSAYFHAEADHPRSQILCIHTPLLKP